MNQTNHRNQVTGATPNETGAIAEQEEEDDGLIDEQGKKFLLFNLAPSWLVSLLTHVLLIVLLALVFMEQKRDSAISFVAADTPGESLDGADMELEPLDFDSSALEMKDVPQETEAAPLESNLATLETQPQDVLSDLAAGESSLVDSEAMNGAGLTGETSQEISGRDGDNRNKLLRKYGGTPESEEAVKLALEWLAKHQMADGGWNFDHTIGSGDRSRKNPGRMTDARNAATAMALLPFLGAGNTHLNGEYKDTVRRGLTFLMQRARIDTKGVSFYEPASGTMYSHGLCSIVFCEAYAMTGDKDLATAAQGSIKFIENFQDPRGGGWRYDPKQPGDTSIVGWQLMALKSAKQSGLDIQKDTLKLATKFLDFASSESGSFYGYTSPPNSDPNYRERAPTAIGLLCRMYLGWDRDHPSLKRGVGWLAEVGPVLRSFRNEQGVNMYHNYYATQVMKQYGGPEWDKWNNEMRDFLVKSLDKEGAERGSWFFDSGNDLGTETGGRLYYTALCCMTLEVYYRYMPLYDEKASADPFPLD
jgi:hypothetical protein